MATESPLVARITLVYFEAGGGHRSVMNAVCAVIREQRRPWDIECLNLQELLDPVAFGSLHLLHHGIWRDAVGLRLRAGSGLMWLLVMMGLGWLLTICRLRSGSLWPAILAHSACTFFMNVTIFCRLM